MTCRSVMYHYVRPNDITQPQLFYLNLDDFRRQLDYFERHWGVITKAEWQAAINNPSLLPNGVLLTFDDGLIDHYDYVWPELRARGHWGIFYVSSGSLQARQLLNVHRVHYLLGRFGGTQVLKALEKLLDNNNFIDGFYDQLKSVPYSKQSMDEHSLQVKRIVNYSLNPDCKDILLGQLFQLMSVDERVVAKTFYMNSSQIREMSDDGFSFGAHGKSHDLLTKFIGDDLRREVSDSVQALNVHLARPSETFCFPYGGPDSWNDCVLTELKTQSIRYGFCVESAVITVADLHRRPLWLPRFDCNEFPYGKARIKQ